MTEVAEFSVWAKIRPDAKREFRKWMAAQTGWREIDVHRLLVAAVDAGRPVQPLRLSYHRRDGQASTIAAYVGDDTLLASIRRLITAQRTVVRVHVESLQLPGTDRRDLAARCEAAVRGDMTHRAQGHALVA